VALQVRLALATQAVAAAVAVGPLQTAAELAEHHRQLVQTVILLLVAVAAALFYQ
jgi:hypothetical protein